MKLLNIIASPRGEQSRTLKISDEFISTLKGKYPDLTIEDLDLFKEDLPDISVGAVNAKYAVMGGVSLNTEAQKSWNEIIKYANGFLSADIYVITSPMWNFSVPYKLKHYIDTIVQPSLLFHFTGNGVEGLAKNKKMYCITSRGNDYGAGSPMQQYDFQEPYLRSIFGLTGITDISFINAQPLDHAPASTASVLMKAKEEAKLLALECEFPISELVV